MSPRCPPYGLREASRQKSGDAQFMLVMRHWQHKKKKKWKSDQNCSPWLWLESEVKLRRYETMIETCLIHTDFPHMIAKWYYR